MDYEEEVHNIMGGSDTSRGINFQYACGISFILDSLLESSWEVLQFEGDEDIEDIVVFDGKGEVILRAQIKQKEDPQQWTPSELKGVLLDFLKCEESEKTIYQFIYAGAEGRAIIDEIKPILHKLEDEDNGSLTPTEKAILEKYLSSEVVAFICKASRRLRFIKWSSERALETRNLLRIRKLFTRISSPDFGNDYEEQIYYKLFHLVAHKTDPKSKYFRRIKRKQIQELLQGNGLLVENEDNKNYREHHIPLPPLTRPSYSLVGRLDLLRDLKQHLLMEKMYHNVALSGLPGVGKTALAIELVHDPEISAHFCDGILWAGPGLHPNVLTILGEWAVAVGIPLAEITALTSVEERARAVRIAIGERRMLLVVDDIWQIETALALRVGGPHCAHLITTRLPLVAQQFALADNVIGVHELNESDSLLLLEQLASTVVRDEPDDARKLVQAVGGLPLALMLLGKYLLRHSSQRRRLYMALERLRSVEERLQLTQPQTPLEHHPSLPLDVPLSLQAIIQISIDALDEKSRHTFHVLSVFPPKPNTFSEEAALAVTEDSVEALDCLYDYGLLESSMSDRYTMHQILSDYARINFENDTYYFKKMATFFADMIRKHELEKQYEVEYEGLDLEITNILAAIQISSEKCLDILPQTVNAPYRFLETRGLYYLTEPYLEKAERIARLSGDDFEQEFALYHLGRIANKLGQYQKATNYLRTALNLAYQRGDIDQVMNVLGNISEAFMELKDYVQAEYYAQESLSLSRNFGSGDINIAARLMLGTLYGKRNDDEKAEFYYREALDISRQLDSYSELSSLLSNLGLIVSRREGYAQAESYLQEALAIALKTKNYEHIAAAQLRSSVAALEDGRYELAEDYLRQALKLAGTMKHHRLIHGILGYTLRVADHCESDTRAKEYLQEALALAHRFNFDDLTCNLLARLGVVASKLGEYTQARDNFQEALILAYRTEQYNLVFNLLINLGKTSIHVNNFSEAKQYFERSFVQASQNNKNRQIILALTMLGQVTATYNKNYDEAKGLIEKGLSLAREQNDENMILDLVVTLYEIAQQQKDYTAAITYLQEALEIARKLNDKEKIYALLIDLYQTLENHQDYIWAEAYLKEALSLTREQNNLERCGPLLVSLAKVASLEQDYVKASEYMEEALILARQRENREEIYAILMDLHRLLKYQENYPQAEAYLQQALNLAREMNNPTHICDALNLLSSFYFDQQSFSLIYDPALEALTLAREEGDQYLIAVSLHNLGRAAEKQGNFVEAHRLGQESLNILEGIEGFPVDFIRQWLAMLSEKM